MLGDKVSSADNQQGILYALVGGLIFLSAVIVIFAVFFTTNKFVTFSVMQKYCGIIYEVGGRTLCNLDPFCDVIPTICNRCPIDISPNNPIGRCQPGITCQPKEFFCPPYQ